MAVAARSTSYLRSILNAFKDLVFVFNAEGLIVDYLKEEESDKLYVPRQQFIGRHHSEVLPAHVVEKINTAIAVIAGGEDTYAFDYVLRINEKDTWFTAVFSAVQHMEEPMYLCVIRDITERKQSEQTLQQALEQLEVYQKQMDMFFAQSLTGFFFVMLDQPVQWNDRIDKDAALDYAFQHLRFTKVNGAFIRQYRVAGKNMEGVFLKDFYKGSVIEAKGILRDLFDKNQLRISRRSSRDDGSELYLEGDYICFRRGDRILGYFGTQQDITRRKHADQSLRASEERYRLLANNMMDLVALHLPDGTYTYVSPSVEKLLGYTVEELTGTSPYRLFHPEDINRIREESHDKAGAGSDVSEMEYRIRKKDGTYIWFSTSTKPIKDESGNVVLLQTVSRDVTERVETFQQLLELNHQKNKLFSIVAHDLRGPIGNCMSLLDLLEARPEPEKTEKYLGYLNKNAHSLYNLLEDLLLWASNQLNTTAFQPVELDLAEEIDVVIGNLREMAAAKKISVSNIVKDASLKVFADKHMLRTVLRNLLSNAIKFTYTGGMITIDAKENQEHTYISVADNGTGIAKKDLENLFSRSSSVSQYGTGGERGTGLGLNICRDYIDRHKGQIKVESKEGMGSTFTVTLPVRTAAAEKSMAM